MDDLNWRVFGALDPIERQVLAHVYVHGRSQHQVAQLLRIPNDVVAAVVAGGLRKVAGRLTGPALDGRVMIVADG